MTSLKRVITVVTAILVTVTLHGTVSEEEAIEHLTRLLIEVYDRQEEYTVLERMVLKFGRAAYIDNVMLWKEHYKNMDELEIELHPRLVKLTERVKECAGSERAGRLYLLLEELTMLAFKNLDLYYLAILEEEFNFTLEELDWEFMDGIMTSRRFCRLKLELYSREKEVKREIKAIIGAPDLKRNLAFYNFVFDFLNKIRESIVEKDLVRIRAILNN